MAEYKNRPQTDKQKTGLDVRPWGNRKTTVIPKRKWQCPNCGVTVPNGIKVKLHREECKAS